MHLSDPKLPIIPQNLRIVFEHANGIVQIVGHITYLQGTVPEMFPHIAPIAGSKVNDKTASWGLIRTTPRAAYYQEIVGE